MPRTVISAFAASTAFAAVVLVATAAATDPVTDPVLTTELQGMEGTEANIVRIEVEPGWVTERHIHPGHVFVYVTKGAIEIDVEGREPQKVSAGEAIYELPDQPMVGRNLSATEGAAFILFQIGPTGEPLIVAQPE